MTARIGSARVSVLAFALVPVGIAIARAVPLYIAPADDIWYQYRSVALALVDLPVAVVALAWLRSPRRPTSDALFAASPLVALAAAAALSASSAIHPVLAWGTAAHLLALALFALAATRVGADARGVPMRALCVVAIVEAALGSVQLATQSTWPTGLVNGWPRELAASDVGASVAALPGVDRWLRAYGTFPHPNTLAAFSAVALVMIANAPGHVSRWRTAGAIAAAAALGASLSRTGALAASLALGTVLLAVMLGRPVRWSRARVTAAVIGLAMLVVAATGAAAARFVRLDAPIERASVAERQRELDAAWALIAHGAAVGAGNIVIAEQTVTPALGEPVHNVFVIAIAEMGPLGIVAVLTVFASLGLLVRRARSDRQVLAAPLALGGALLPLMLLDHFLWTQPEGRTLLAWALAAAAARPLREDASSA